MRGIFDNAQQLHQDCSGCIRRQTTIVKNGVALHLNSPGLTNLLCIDCDNCSAFGGSEKKPDLIILASWAGAHTTLAVVAMTAGRVRSDNIDQLRCGATKCQDHKWFSLPRQFLASFVILHHGKVHEADLQEFKRRRISFLGDKPVLLKRSITCQTELAHLVPR